MEVYKKVDVELWVKLSLEAQFHVDMERIDWIEKDNFELILEHLELILLCVFYTRARMCLNINNNLSLWLAFSLSSSFSKSAELSLPHHKKL